MLHDYQKFTRTTAIYPEERANEYLALGLASEAGEVASIVKKQIRDGHEWTGEQREDARRNVLKESGDCLYYIARILDTYGYTLEDAIQNNIAKLSSRKERGMLSGSGDNR